MSDEQTDPQSVSQSAPPYANPYAPPYSQPPPRTAPPTEPVPPAMLYATTSSAAGIWRYRKYLVMHKSVQLPDLCVKSGDPADGYKLKRSLSWHHPAIYLSILAGLLIYVILALVLRQTAVIHIGLSERFRRKRRNTILRGWLSCLGCIALSIYFFYANEPAWGSLCILLFIVLAIVAKNRAQLVSPYRIDQNYVWLRGVNRAYLDLLPEWPYRV